MWMDLADRLSDLGPSQNKHCDSTYMSGRLTSVDTEGLGEPGLGGRCLWGQSSRWEDEAVLELDGGGGGTRV